MLRGPQTLGELKQRSERLHRFADLRSVEDVLDRLAARELGRWLERMPGQKEARYTHLLEDDRLAPDDAEAQEDTGTEVGGGVQPDTGAKVDTATQAGETQPDELAREVARLRQELDALRRDVDGLR